MNKWSATLLLSAALQAGNAVCANVLINPSFESGLAPWVNSSDFCNGCVWDVTSTDANTGSSSALVSGNRLLEQDFVPISASSITEASLWLKMPDSGIAAISFLYSDASTEENIVNVGSAWAKFDVTSFLDAGKSLAGFGVYGCNLSPECGGLHQTLADDFTISAVPEPSAFFLMMAGLGLVGMARRRRGAGLGPECHA